jgi:hypothetical protein
VTEWAGPRTAARLHRGRRALRARAARLSGLLRLILR